MYLYSNTYTDGDLIVKCSYRFNTKGDLDVSLIEHLLKPKDESPKDVEVFIRMYMYKYICICINMYV
jgi:hypothetical protein